MLDDDFDENKDTNVDKSNDDCSVQFGNVSMENPGPSDQNSTSATNQTELQETQNKIIDLPSTDTAATTEKEPELDQEILNLLGDTPSKEKKYGSHIKNEIAIRWNHILTTGLTKEDRKGLLDKYFIPENCKNIDAPILNPETKAALSEVLIKKDKAIETKQKRIAAAISSLGEAITHLFNLGFKDPTVIKPLLDAARLICDVQHTESLIRRSFICSTLKKDFKNQLYDTDIDKFLFSEKLADTLKAAKAIQKSGTDLKYSNQKRKSTPTRRPLNSKPPLPSSRSAGVSRKAEPADTNRRAPARPQQTASAPPPTRSQPRSQAPPNSRRR